MDDWITTDCTADEVEELFAEDMGRDMMRRLADVRRKVALVAAGNAREVYYQFAMTHEEAEERRAEVHDYEPECEDDPVPAPEAAPQQED